MPLSARALSGGRQQPSSHLAHYTVDTRSTNAR